MRILPLVLASLVSACTPDIYAEVQSSTSWSGSFGGATVDGSGSRRIDLPDDLPQCVVVQKQTEQGSLRVRVAADGGGLIGPTVEESGWISTTAAYGVVSACAE